MDSWTLPAIGAATAVVVGLSQLGKRKKKKKSLQRQWSFTSMSMVHGAFPKHVNYPEPIINAVLYFQDCPNKDEIVSKLVTKITAYERFASVPDADAGFGRLVEDLDVSRLVRHVPIDCDQEGVHEVLQELLHYPGLENDRDGLPWWELVVLDVRRNRSLRMVSCPLC